MDQKERIGGGIFLLLSLLYGWLALDISQFIINEDNFFTPRTLPLAICGLSIMCSIALLRPWSGLRYSRLDLKGYNWPLAIAMAALIFIYNVILEWLGFLIASLLLLNAGFWMLKERRWGIMLLFSGLIVGVFYIILVKLLGIYLPPGSWFE